MSINFIKLKSFLTFIGLLSAQQTLVFANDTTTSNASHPIIIYSGNQSQRPKAPSKQNISCYYDGENLDIDFEINEGICTLWVKNNDTAKSFQYSFDSSSVSSFYIGEIENGDITITTQLGNTYYGYLSE